MESESIKILKESRFIVTAVFLKIGKNNLSNDLSDTQEEPCLLSKRRSQL